MSDKIDEVTAALSRAAQGLVQAQQQIAAASNKAEEIAVQAGGHLGMHAVARQLSQVGELLQVGHGLVGTSAQTFGRAADEVGKVHAGMSPDTVTKHLTAASGVIDNARSEMFAGLDRLDDAITRTHVALEGAQPGPLVGMIEGAKDSVRDPALREANVAHDAIDALIAAGGQLGE